MTQGEDAVVAIAADGSAPRMTTMAMDAEMDCSVECSTSGLTQNNMLAKVPTLVKTGIDAKSQSSTVRLSDLNPHIICALCGGYYVDATTVIECLHSFCRTCILNHLDKSNSCPVCEIQIHKTRPLLAIRRDELLQNIVYKLVPGLFRSEMRRRREFYEDVPEKDLPESLEARGEIENPGKYVTPDERISVSLQYLEPSYQPPSKKSRKSKKHHRRRTSKSPSPMASHLQAPKMASSMISPGASSTCSSVDTVGLISPVGSVSKVTTATTTTSVKSSTDQAASTTGDGNNNKDRRNHNEGDVEVQVLKASDVAAASAGESVTTKRYLSVPAAVTVGLLKKFVRMKYQLSSVEHLVDVFFADENLVDELTLMDLAETHAWERDGKPKEFYFQIHQRVAHGRKRRSVEAMEAVKSDEPLLMVSEATSGAPEATPVAPAVMDAPTVQNAEDKEQKSDEKEKETPAEEAPAPRETPAEKMDTTEEPRTENNSSKELSESASSDKPKVSGPCTIEEAFSKLTSGEVKVPTNKAKVPTIIRPMKTSKAPPPTTKSGNAISNRAGAVMPSNGRPGLIKRVSQQPARYPESGQKGAEAGAKGAAKPPVFSKVQNQPPVGATAPKLPFGATMPLAGGPPKALYPGYARTAVGDSQQPSRVLPKLSATAIPKQPAPSPQWPSGPHQSTDKRMTAFDMLLQLNNKSGRAPSVPGEPVRSPGSPGPSSLPPPLVDRHLPVPPMVPTASSSANTSTSQPPREGLKLKILSGPDRKARVEPVSEVPRTPPATQQAPPTSLRPKSASRAEIEEAAARAYDFPGSPSPPPAEVNPTVEKLRKVRLARYNASSKDGKSVEDKKTPSSSGVSSPMEPIPTSSDEDAEVEVSGTKADGKVEKEKRPEPAAPVKAAVEPPSEPRLVPKVLLKKVDNIHTTVSKPPPQKQLPPDAIPGTFDDKPKTASAPAENQEKTKNVPASGAIADTSAKKALAPAMTSLSVATQGKQDQQQQLKASSVSPKRKPGVLSIADSLLAKQQLQVSSDVRKTPTPPQQQPALKFDVNSSFSVSALTSPEKKSPKASTSSVAPSAGSGPQVPQPSSTSSVTVNNRSIVIPSSITLTKAREKNPSGSQTPPAATPSASAPPVPSEKPKAKRPVPGLIGMHSFLASGGVTEKSPSPAAPSRTASPDVISSIPKDLQVSRKPVPPNSSFNFGSSMAIAGSSVSLSITPSNKVPRRTPPLATPPVPSNGMSSSTANFLRHMPSGLTIINKTAQQQQQQQHHQQQQQSQDPFTAMAAAMHRQQQLQRDIMMSNYGQYMSSVAQAAAAAAAANGSRQMNGTPPSGDGQPLMTTPGGATVTSISKQGTQQNQSLRNIPNPALLRRQVAQQMRVNNNNTTSATNNNGRQFGQSSEAAKGGQAGKGGLAASKPPPPLSPIIKSPFSFMGMESLARNVGDPR